MIQQQNKNFNIILFGLRTKTELDQQANSHQQETESNMVNTNFLLYTTNKGFVW